MLANEEHKEVIAKMEEKFFEEKVVLSLHFVLAIYLSL